jgi:signal transduction histidine kinase
MTVTPYPRVSDHARRASRPGYGRPSLGDLALVAVLFLDAVLVPLVFEPPDTLSAVSAAVALAQTLPVLCWRTAPAAALAVHLLTKPLTLLSGVVAPEIPTVLLLYGIARRRSRPVAALGLGLAVVTVGALAATDRYPLMLVGVLPTVAVYTGVWVLGLSAGLARTRADALLHRQEQAELEAAAGAQRTQIALELRDGVAGRIRRLAELARDAERADRPAERFAAVRDQARHGLTELRRMLRLLRGAEPVPTEPTPTEPTPTEPTPTGPDAAPSRAAPEPAPNRAEPDPAPTRAAPAWVPAPGDVLLTAGALVVLVALHLVLPAEPPEGDPAALWTMWRLPAGAAGVAAVVLQVLPLAWRRRAPGWALLVATVGTVAAPPLVAYSYLGSYARIVLVYSVAAWIGRRGAGLVIIAVAETAQQLSVALLPSPVPPAFPQTPATIVYDVALVAALWLAGDVQRRTRVATERALRLERAHRTRRALYERRLHLARDLHDVLAHHISGIAVQAGAALTVSGREPGLVGAMAENIRREADTALDALPRLVAALDPDGSSRDAEGPAELGVPELSELARPLREAGAEVTVEVRGEPPPATATSLIFARRIAQEALTNVLRHAGASRTRVLLTHDEDRVTLTVDDDGPAPAHEPAAAGSGLGLVGMRERAITLGGHLEAGRRSDGGWTVRAELPH